jgi:site-specific DNA-methyltransferase (adenine-specific)
VSNRIFVHSSEQMPELPDRSVHLMVTSPPYNVGKEYDEDLTQDEYSALLGRVLAETYRVLVDGGRACVNVANLGRKPYIPLHAIVIEQAESAGFFMRGEIIWDKGAGAGVSTAWGSWKSPANPTLRDVHEYILVFQKPPFGRKKPAGREATISREQFLEYTKSVWEFGPQSAKQAAHPAPFPVELPERLIQLYTYSDEAVLDPFMGTGATALAAVKTGRVYIGYDLSEQYANTAMQRIDAFKSGKKFRAAASVQARRLKPSAT